MAQKVFAGADGDIMTQQLNHLLEKSFEIRMRVLSTTNFGLATPFLARQREAVMASLLEQLDNCTHLIEAEVFTRAESLIREASPPKPAFIHGKLVDTFLHMENGEINNPSGDRILEFTLPTSGPGSKRYFLVDTNGHILSANIEKKIDLSMGHSTA